MLKISNIQHHMILREKEIIFNLLRTAGRFINQRHKGQERIISITIANKKVTLMQM